VTLMITVGLRGNNECQSYCRSRQASGGLIFVVSVVMNRSVLCRPHESYVECGVGEETKCNVGVRQDVGGADAKEEYSEIPGFK
jgi:hypothetical protein